MAYLWYGCTLAVLAASSYDFFVRRKTGGLLRFPPQPLMPDIPTQGGDA